MQSFRHEQEWIEEATKLQLVQFSMKWNWFGQPAPAATKTFDFSQFATDTRVIVESFASIHERTHSDSPAGPDNPRTTSYPLETVRSEGFVRNGERSRNFWIINGTNQHPGSYYANLSINQHVGVLLSYLAEFLHAAELTLWEHTAMHGQKTLDLTISRQGEPISHAFDKTQMVLKELSGLIYHFIEVTAPMFGISGRVSTP